MAENIDFQFPMKKSCQAPTSSRFCKDVQHGHAKTIRCLQDNLADPAHLGHLQAPRSRSTCSTPRRTTGVPPN